MRNATKGESVALNWDDWGSQGTFNSTQRHFRLSHRLRVLLVPCGLRHPRGPLDCQQRLGTEQQGTNSAVAVSEVCAQNKRLIFQLHCDIEQRTQGW